MISRDAGCIDLSNSAGMPGNAGTLGSEHDGNYRTNFQQHIIVSGSQVTPAVVIRHVEPSTFYHKVESADGQAVGTLFGKGRRVEFRDRYDEVRPLRKTTATRPSLNPAPFAGAMGTPGIQIISESAFLPSLSASLVAVFAADTTHSFIAHHQPLSLSLR